MSDFADHPISIAEARTIREQDAGIWSPRDALIHMLRGIDSGEIEMPDDLVILYAKNNDNGTRFGHVVACADPVRTHGLIYMAQADMIAGCRE